MWHNEKPGYEQTKPNKNNRSVITQKYFNNCYSIFNSEFDYCLVSGKASYFHCFYNNIYYTRYQEHKNKVLSSSSNKTIFFFPYSRINQSWVVEEKSHSISDPDVQCGFLFLRRNYNNQATNNATMQQTSNNQSTFNNRSNQQQFKIPDGHSCNEDSCLTHLKALHLYTPMHDLTTWRKKTEFSGGTKVGGATCELLQIYGISILIPILLNLSFSIVVFIKNYRKQTANLFEIIPLLLLFYPQYKTIKFLCQYIFIHRDENLLNEEKEENDRTVASLEPFLESCLQVSTPENTFKKL